MDSLAQAGSVQPISKGFYLGSILGGLGGAVVLVILGAIIVHTSGDPEVGAILSMLSLPLMLFGAVMVAVLIYKLWEAIQGGSSTRTTPGKAVGFLFIPFFNIYWMFQVYWGWAQDFNKYAKEKGLTSPSMPEGLGLTICILTLAAMVPLLGLIIALVNIVLILVYFSKACDAVNALAATT